MVSLVNSTLITAKKVYITMELATEKGGIATDFDFSDGIGDGNGLSVFHSSLSTSRPNFISPSPSTMDSASDTVTA